MRRKEESIMHVGEMYMQIPHAGQTYWYYGKELGVLTKIDTWSET